MNLTQERINEVALECGLKHLDIIHDGSIQAFANEFLSRIREEQEAVALAAIHPDGFLHSAMIIERNMDVVEAWEKANIKTVPLFTIPPAAPECNCKELGEALEKIIEAEWMVTHYWGGDRQSVLKQAGEALAKHKASMGEKR